MYIFQPDRFLLDKQIRSVSGFVFGRVLDVGSGEMNRYGKYFKSDEYIRMDPGHDGKVDLVGSADDIPLQDQSVDSVICTQVFEHLENPQKSADEIYRVMKKGGYLIVTAPQMNELHEDPHDFFRYTRFGLESIFKKSGFDVVLIEQRGGYHSTIAQMKIRYMIDRFGFYDRPVLGRIFSLMCKIYGRAAILLDNFDKSVSNRKHAIGWCVVLRK